MSRNFGMPPADYVKHMSQEEEMRRIDFRLREMDAVVWLCLANLFATAIQIGLAIFELSLRR